MNIFQNKLKPQHQSMINATIVFLAAAFLLSFLAPVIWSVLDFQGYPDFFVFLPYFAISFAWMVFLTLGTRD